MREGGGVYVMKQGRENRSREKKQKYQHRALLAKVIAETGLTSKKAVCMYVHMSYLSRRQGSGLPACWDYEWGGRVRRGEGWERFDGAWAGSGAGNGSWMQELGGAGLWAVLWRATLSISERERLTGIDYF